MTLNTQIAILAPVDVTKLYEFLRPLVNTPDWVEPERRVGYRAYTKMLGNPLGVGADAFLTITYGADGPIPDQRPGVTDEDELRWLNSSPVGRGEAAALVSFDTAYGFHGPNGQTCSGLHRSYIEKLGAFLDEQGIAWQWQNEYTGEWFVKYDGLAEFA